MGNYFKIIELFILGVLFPLTIVVFKFSQFILLFLWFVNIYAIILLVIFYRNKFNLKSLLHINYNKNRLYFYIIFIRWLLLSFLLLLFTYYIFPNKLFLIQKNNVDLLYKIFILYPFLSALPQEFIFCTFFFIRYKSLFKNEKNLVLTSAIIFCFAHIFSINWVAPLLSIFGGFIFASTYKKTRSLILVSLEHALYGNSLFAIGLGWFFWGGSVAT
ncbi:MAG: hypothetical protein CMJ13_01060 [Pelagibacterales bacterium]|nr:hypothetical protein [Pelagibacterales bacterium]|tara:strand:+ start:493 stop:1140 length:648 start_codon:yes stop_codon:yes gene_type:complete